MYRGAKVNKNYLYPYVPDKQSSSLNKPTNNTLSVFSLTVDAPAPQHSHNFPRPLMNRQSSSAHSSTNTAYFTPASTSTGNTTAEHVLQATTYSNPVQQAHRRVSRPSSRRSQASFSSDTCSQPSLIPSPKTFNEKSSEKWPSQLQDDIPVGSEVQDTSRDFGSFRDREDSGTSNFSISGSRSPAQTSVGSSSRSRGRPRVDRLYEIKYDRLKMRSRISREARKKETAERLAADGTKEKRKTSEYWKNWQTKEENGGWI